MDKTTGALAPLQIQLRRLLLAEIGTDVVQSSAIRRDFSIQIGNDRTRRQWNMEQRTVDCDR